MSQINEFLQQKVDERTNYDDNLNKLLALGRQIEIG
jgi:hypothetical protein